MPPFSLGGPDDYAISPDGKEVCYAMNADPVPAISTNADLFVVSIGGGDRAQDHRQSRRRQSARNTRRTASTSPGARSSAPGYESDRWRLLVLERATGRVTNLTETLDRWVEQLHLVARFRAPVLHRPTIAAARPSSSFR